MVGCTGIQVKPLPASEQRRRCYSSQTSPALHRGARIDGWDSQKPDGVAGGWSELTHSSWVREEQQQRQASSYQFLGSKAPRVQDRHRAGRLTARLAEVSMGLYAGPRRREGMGQRTGGRQATAAERASVRLRGAKQQTPPGWSPLDRRQYQARLPQSSAQGSHSRDDRFRGDERTPPLGPHQRPSIGDRLRLLCRVPHWGMFDPDWKTSTTFTTSVPGSERSTAETSSPNGNTRQATKEHEPQIPSPSNARLQRLRRRTVQARQKNRSRRATERAEAAGRPRPLRTSASESLLPRRPMLQDPTAASVAAAAAFHPEPRHLVK